MQLLGQAGGLGGPRLEEAVLGLLLAFILGQLIAWVYIYTHHGLSYSRTFVQSIILVTLIVAMGMVVIGNNLIVAVGLIGALAVIRFRNILKDTRDTAFVFFGLILGMACGTGNYGLAILGTAVYVTVLMYLHWTSFGSRHFSDGFLRFQLASQSGVHLTDLQPVLSRYCRRRTLVSQRIARGGEGEIAYRLTMRDPGRADQLVSELRGIEGIMNVTFVLQEEATEL